MSEQKFKSNGLKIRVPSNYDAENKIYNGEWDGTYKMAQTDNPAWILLDLILRSNQSLEDGQEKMLYEVAKYCDELIDIDDKKEPRITFNGVVPAGEAGKKIINELKSMFDIKIKEDE
jgi:predicted phage tail protein